MACYARKNVSQFTWNVIQFWAVFWAYLFLSYSEKKGLRIEKSKMRFWDLKTARMAISSTFYQFMYVLIPILSVLFVNTIMSSCVILIETCCCETLFIVNDNLVLFNSIVLNVFYILIKYKHDLVRMNDY